MPIDPLYLAPFKEGKYYHVYNRSNNCELLFKNEWDKYFFLNKYKEYLNPHTKTIAFVLMGNHFHFLIRIKKKSETVKYLSSLNSTDLSITGGKLLAKPSCDAAFNCFIVKQFSRFFISYARNINDVNKRSGHLFSKPFKRKAVLDESYLKYLVFYIHANPINSDGTKSFKSNIWSSYDPSNAFANDIVDKKFLLQLFKGEKAYRQFHELMLSYKFNFPNQVEKF